MSKRAGFFKYWSSGEAYVMCTASALGLTLLIVGAMVVVVMKNGLGVFWPSEIVTVRLHNGRSYAGEVVEREEFTRADGTDSTRIKMKIGNRDLYQEDFKWIDEADIATRQTDPEAVVLERLEYGNFHGFLREVRAPGAQAPAPAAADALWARLNETLAAVADKRRKIERLDETLAGIAEQMHALELREKKLRYRGVPDEAPEMLELRTQRQTLSLESAQWAQKRGGKHEELARYTALFADAGGLEREIALSGIVRAYRPNTMGFGDKAGYYAVRVWELLSARPRESNTEGGLFPAIFGTVMMVFMMSCLSFPFGVVAGIYLREYARDGFLVRVVRIGVNNLAGIPSIVYGIFGLGFFIYGVGGFLDRQLYPELLPTPTFGTGGILWASLTLGLLTVPVVIVATEEALATVPRGMREASLALGATRLQTLARVVLPAASPGILTGFILAMARAAGEVAPLMITGVVKLAPSLPVDGEFPFFHLDRKFMHLGFHIYDIGFQSPNVDAAKPMVYVTTLLLVLIVLAMSSLAILLRNRLKKKYTHKSF